MTHTPFQLVDAPSAKSLAFPNLDDKARVRLDSGQPSQALSSPLQSEANEHALADIALATLRAGGAHFGDLRLGRDLNRYVSVLDTNVQASALSASEGMGVRALVDGFWGFAATDDLSENGIKTCAKRAVSMARAVAKVTPAHLGLKTHALAPEPAHIAVFHTPVGICPFEAPLEAITGPLCQAAETALAIAGVKRVMASVNCYGRRRLFASTEGARILTTHSIVNVEQKIVAVANGTSGYRTLVSPALAGGIEHFLSADFPAQAKGAAQEALLKCHARKPESGAWDLIMDGHHLALTMHESVGHPTELDRVLGYELNMAGGSFASLDKKGVFRYGSPIVNFTADNRIRYGGASVGYDDEGVECQKFPIVSEGILVGYGTNRETASQAGYSRSNGTARATSWSDPPIVRIPNLYLEPGRQSLSRAALIADTRKGILMLGRDSFSIDQMRYNFQFGADMCYLIENGRITEPLRDVIYQSITPEFWGSCDAICDATEWQMHGVFNCGKGQPGQVAKMMHGASPSRFRNIKVGY